VKLLQGSLCPETRDGNIAENLALEVDKVFMGAFGKKHLPG
jgi:hypothetical protein